MKTLTLIVCLASTLMAKVEAQTEKGRWTVGAEVGNFTYQNQYGNQSFTGSLSPSGGYFITNGLVVGTGIPVSFATQTFSTINSSDGRYTTTAIGLAPFVRYFIGRSKLKPFLGVTYSYSKAVGKYQADPRRGGAESRTEGYATSLIPNVGVAYFINRNLALNVGINYNINHQEYETVRTSPTVPGQSNSDTNTESLSLGIGFRLFIGK